MPPRNRHHPLVLFLFASLVSCRTSSLPEDPSISTTNPAALQHSVMTDAVTTYEVIKDAEWCDTLAIPSSGTFVDRLEQARRHYLRALQAQSAIDSSLSAREFEKAIDILLDLSESPDISKNIEYSDLLRAVIEDYERYIISIDRLSPESSVFALREKLISEVDSIDISSVRVPSALPVKTEIPLVLNYLVEKNISFFQQKGRAHFERWLRLSGKYFPMMKRVFHTEGLPEELVYLSMIESGLNPVARSWANAVGIWQFIRSTGRLYDLKVNFWLDERRDFEKATRAAVKHLKDLYERFGDWYLALAAYNAGAARIERAMKRGQSRDFWALRKYLPRETRNYVPQFIAVALMGMRPMDFGFLNVELADSVAYDVVSIDGSVDLRVLARCAETDIETLRELNPELLQNYTPYGLRGYSLRIPPGTAEVFAANYKKVPENQKRRWAVHQVRRGETLGGIARRYSVPSSAIAELNRISNPRTLSVGRTLLIPVPGESKLAKQVARTEGRKAEVAEARSPADREKVLHPVKKGDTLGKIAALYSVPISDLRNWNNIPYGSFVAEGETLTVWVRRDSTVAIRGEKTAEVKQDLAAIDSPARSSQSEMESIVQAAAGSSHFYRVRPGDTLWKIAREFGVTVEELKKWNHLETDDIGAGRRLRILSPGVVRGSPLITVSSRRYTVKKGDTLWGISRKFGVDLSELRRTNALADRGIHPGDELIIPR